jgi:integrase
VDAYETRPDFYDEDDFRLCEGAERVGPREHLLVLLGGDAGLLRGEMIGLRWVDVDFRRAQLRIEQAAWKRSKRQPALRSSVTPDTVDHHESFRCGARPTDSSRPPRPLTRADPDTYSASQTEDRARFPQYPGTRSFGRSSFPLSDRLPQLHDRSRPVWMLHSFRDVLA